MRLPHVGVVPCLLVTLAVWIGGPALSEIRSAAAAEGGRRSGPPPEEAWLEGLRARVAGDLQVGRPLVVQAHLSLCDNSIIRCGGAGRGDGDDLGRNLYWATGGGFQGWFDRRGSGWTRVPLHPTQPAVGEPGVLEVRAWRREMAGGPAWAAALGRPGRSARVPVIVVVHAWRGRAIDATVSAYLRDLVGETPRTIRLADGTTVAAGGAAHLVAYLGHNRFMDYRGYDWRWVTELASRTRLPKGHISVGCMTAQYLGRRLNSPQRVPLLFVRDFVFAGAHSFEGAVRAFASGGSLSQARRAAAEAYAEGQRTTYGRVAIVFTNPAAPRWVRDTGSR